MYVGEERFNEWLWLEGRLGPLLNDYSVPRFLEHLDFMIQASPSALQRLVLAQNRYSNVPRNQHYNRLDCLDCYPR